MAEQKPSFQEIIRSKSKDIDMSFRRGFEEFDQPKNSGGSGRYALWFIALASVILLFFVLSYFFSGATVTVTPKSAVVTLEDLSFTAIKATSTDALGFEVMGVKGEETRMVTATETTAASQKATGQIIIFNNFSSASQPLITGTRFETPDGKIYKISAPITVPGQQTKDGQLVPGSVEATVTAAEAGEAYNIPLSDFTIPGFKSSPRYDKIYARGKTVMSGGSSGVVHVVPEVEANQIRSELSGALKEKLISQAKAQLPPGYVFFPSAVVFIEEGGQGPAVGTEEQVLVRESGTLQAFIFKQETLTKEIAEKGITTYDDLPVLVQNLDELQFRTSEDISNPNAISELTFGFTGTADVVWNVDTAGLRTDLIGKQKKEFQSIARRYPSIEKASISIRPFWKSRVPENAEKIKIINTLESSNNK